VEAGLLDPDVAARELGYDNWYDMTRLPRYASMMNAGQALRQSSGQARSLRATDRTLDERLHRLRFESSAQRYRHVRPRLVAETPAQVEAKTALPVTNDKIEHPQGAAIEDWLEG
jgi:hypothetical protein